MSTWTCRERHARDAKAAAPSETTESSLGADDDARASDWEFLGLGFRV